MDDPLAPKVERSDSTASIALPAGFGYSKAPESSDITHALSNIALQAEAGSNPFCSGAGYPTADFDQLQVMAGYFCRINEGFWVSKVSQYQDNLLS